MIEQRTEVRRPLVIEQDVPAFPGTPMAIRLDHEGRGSLGLTVTHPFYREEVGIRLSLSSALAIREAIDTLLEEQAANSPFVSPMQALVVLP